MPNRGHGHRLEEQVAIDDAQNRLRLRGKDRHHVRSQRRVASKAGVRIALGSNEFHVVVACGLGRDFVGALTARTRKPRAIQDSIHSLS